MTIGPAPMIRIDLMSVRLGIGSLVHWAQKKGALFARPGNSALGQGPARERCFRPDSQGREGRLWAKGGSGNGAAEEGHAPLVVADIAGCAFGVEAGGAQLFQH